MVGVVRLRAGRAPGRGLCAALLLSAMAATAVACSGGGDAKPGGGSGADITTIGPVAKASHPLDPLTAAELEVFRSVLDQAGYAAGSQYPYVALDEPDKSAVLAWRSGDALERRAFAVVRRNDDTFEAVVDLGRRTLVSWTPRGSAGTGFVSNEYGVAPAAVQADQRFAEGLAARSLTASDVVLLTFGPGSTNSPGEQGRRLARVLPYLRGSDANYFSRPVEGLMATVDLETGEVLSVTDSGAVPVPPAYTAPDPARQRPPLEPLPSGASATPNVAIDGHSISWAGWSMRWAGDRRTGIALHSLVFDGGAGARRVMYEAYLSDLFVPYHDPDPEWAFRTLLDSVEFGLGSTLSRLVPGVDCPVGAAFVDVVIPDDGAQAQVRQQTLCAFERSTGNPAYRHEGSAAAEVELVLRWISTIGNYDYIVDYVFGADGSVRFHVFAAGVVLQKGVDASTVVEAGDVGVDHHGVLVGDGLVATNHDHYMNFRLDLDVDQTANELVRERIVTEAVVGNPSRTQIWRTEQTVVGSESAARYTPDPRAPERILVRSTTANGPVGHQPGYEFDMGDAVAVAPAATSGDPGMRRGGWAVETLWATPHTRGERFASGLYVPDGSADAGLVAWTAADRPLAGTDLVVWFSVGFHHIVRTEDLPNMPAHEAHFGLMPANAYPYNPFLDLAPSGAGAGRG